MAPRGRRPKPPGQAVTRHLRVQDWAEVEATPFTEGPALPKRRRNGKSRPTAMAERWSAC